MSIIDPRRQIVPVVALTAEEIIDDLTDLARFGVGMVEAAHRVGKTAEACERFLLRHDRADLARTLRAQGPAPSDTLAVERRQSREQYRSRREQYAARHGEWAAGVRANAAALLTVLAPDDPETVAQRRRDLLGGAA